MKNRRRARSVALKVLYELDSTGHEPGTVLANRLADEKLADDAAAFVRQLDFPASTVAFDAAFDSKKNQ